MKTRLLKKIRKRYSITKVEELASDACSEYRNAKVEFGMPFYVLEDSEWFTGEIYKSFDEAKDRLSKWIIKDYGEQFRHKPEKSTKVWWSK